jgi:hypothetical protein
MCCKTHKWPLTFNLFYRTCEAWKTSVSLFQYLLPVLSIQQLIYFDITPFFFFFYSSDGIATCYGLDDPGIESWWGSDFPHTSRPALEPTGSFPGVRRSVRGVDQPPHLAPRLKKEYIYTSTPRVGLRGLF